MKLSYSRDFDPDRSTWAEHGDHQNRCLFILRVFFEKSHESTEEIGNFVYFSY